MTADEITKAFRDAEEQVRACVDEKCFDDIQRIMAGLPTKFVGRWEVVWHVEFIEDDEDAD